MCSPRSSVRSSHSQASNARLVAGPPCWFATRTCSCGAARKPSSAVAQSTRKATQADQCVPPKRLRLRRVERQVAAAAVAAPQEFLPAAPCSACLVATRCSLCWALDGWRCRHSPPSPAPMAGAVQLACPHLSASLPGRQLGSAPTMSVTTLQARRMRRAMPAAQRRPGPSPLLPLPHTKLH